jgi:tyrosyl-tRNA synthetase
METVTVPRDRLDKVIVSAGLAPSNSDANRMIRAGAVSVDGEKALDNKFELPESFVLKLGRNWKRVNFV